MSGGSVLQHLMAEQQAYRVEADNQQSTAEVIQPPTESCSYNSPSTKIKYDYKYPSTPPRRALSDESPIERGNNAASFSKKSSSRSESSSQAQARSINVFSPSAHPAQEELINSNSGLLSKLRKEFRTSAFSYLQRDTRINDAAAVGTQHAITSAPKCHVTDTDLLFSTSPKQSFGGHPKSNSTGEDYYRADSKGIVASSKFGKRRGKSAVQVMRSRSLHCTKNTRIPKCSHYRPQTDITAATESDSNDDAAVMKKSNASTTSSGSVGSENKRSPGLSMGEGVFQLPINEESGKTTTDLPLLGVKNGRKKQTQLGKQQQLSRIQSSMVVTPSGMGGLPQTTLPQTNPHGPYYATVPSNPVVHHQLPQRHSPIPPQQPAVSQNTPAPRGPPPPYPQMNGDDSAGHPRRPNSLSLSGQVSRKKLEYGGAQGNVGGLTSPAISTTTRVNNFSYPMSAGTPIHESLLFNIVQEPTVPISTINSSNESSLQGFGITSQSQQAHFKRTGSAKRFQQAVTTSQSQMVEIAMNGSTATNYSSSVYQQSRFDQARSQSSTSNVTPQKQLSTSPTYSSQQIGDIQASYTAGSGNISTGFSLGKSDSNASTSSGSSRIARRTKRNSKNCSNASGSSSSTGNSRPNSSGDYLDRMLYENEVLKNQLHAVEKKLKKYQNVEKELSQVTEDYSTLQLSVTKTENMQAALRTQLEAANARTLQENEILRERINTLTELVETLQFSNKNTQHSSGDVMTYKIKVQEMQVKERLLQEQLEEAQDRISEQAEDITLLSSSLERVQATAASLEEQLVEKRRLDQYAEDLSPFLDALSETVAARLQAEKEIEIASVAQRQSTSSNDEGISEMDAAENLSYKQSCSTQSMTSMMARDGQIIRAHAEMLKWQHTYLQTALLRELSTRNETCATSQSHLYSMLYRHRHAISEPSASKTRSFELPLWATYTSRSNFPKNLEHVDLKKLKHSHRRERTTSEQNGTSGRCREEDIADCDIRPQRSETIKTQTSTLTDTRLESDSVSEGKDLKCNEKPATSENPEAQASNEVDSPSEGYHSQQSSGSPTPSSERSSLHFPEGDSRVTAVLNPSLDHEFYTATISQPCVGVNRQATAIPGPTGHGSNTGVGKRVLTKVVDV